MDVLFAIGTLAFGVVLFLALLGLTIVVERGSGPSDA